MVMLVSTVGIESDPSFGESGVFLTKPVRVSVLYNTLTRLFAGEVASKTQLSGQREEESEFDPHMAERLPLRILLAEDNTINQKVALLMLERLGYRADVAANGLEVLDALRRQPYDVILMDMQMPEMDGLEATRRILAGFPAEIQPFIIAMTANAMRGDREQCLEAGMDDYISKPVEVKELIASLNRCLPRVSQPESDAVSSALPAIYGFSLDSRGPYMENRELSISNREEVGTEGRQLLDPAALRRLKATLGKRAVDMLPGLIASFFEDAEKLQTKAQEALQQNRAEELRRLAHTLKSNSATFGASELTALCLDLETRAKTMTLDGAADLLAGIRIEFEKAKTALEILRRETPG